MHRLRLYGWSILQTALAASLAYFVAAVVPFTERNLLVNQAAISAILVVVLTPPQAALRKRRS